LLEIEQKKSLAESICDCIEEAIDSNYGDNVAQVIFNNFNRKFSLNKIDVASNPSRFEELLEDIFGRGTACLLIKRSVTKELALHFQIAKDMQKSSSISQVINWIVNNAY
jgi:hypothetical protein